MFNMSNHGKSRPETHDEFRKRNEGSRRPKPRARPSKPADYDIRPHRDGESKVQHRIHGLTKLYDRIVGNPVPKSTVRGRTKYRAPHPEPRDSPSPPPRRTSSPPPRRASSPPPRETPSPSPTKDDDDNAYIPDPLDDPFGLKESNIVLRM